MDMKTWLMGLVLGCWLTGGAPSVTATEPDIRRDSTVEAIEKVLPSVVNVATERIIRSSHPLEELLRQFYDPYYQQQPQKSYSLGSGVIIDEEGYIVTNDHVVQRASRISVKLHDGREYDCERVATSQRNDVALIKIKAKPGEKFTAVRFAPDGDLILGETVIALGNPFGLGGSVSKGILSSKDRRPPSGNEPLDVENWLQTDAAINPGNSGGPLINLRGELIGLNVAVYREGQGIGFAIPVKLVTEALAESFTPESLKSLWFGARVKPGPYPLRINTVEKGSPADKAGLRAGDEVLEANGNKPRSFIEFLRDLTVTGDTRDIPLVIRHEGATRQVSLRLVPERDFFNAKLIKSKLGADVQVLTEELAGRFGLQNADGLLVAGVEPGGAAEKAGLQSGFIIRGINGEPPGDVVSAARALHALKPGESVSFQLLVPRRRGNFLTIQQGEVKVEVP